MAFDVSVTVAKPNSRGHKRLVTLTAGDSKYQDAIDPASGFEREKMIARAAGQFGLPAHRLAALDAAIVHAAEQAEAGPGPIIYPALTAAELDGEEYGIDYLIPGVLAAGQHAIGGGPHKTLKTLILGCDLGFSLAVGGLFLGYFRVARPVRTCLMSGECGFPVLQENLRRVARAAGTELRYVGNLLVCEALPKFGAIDHVEAMGRFLQDNGIECCVIDPAYLCFDGADAANVFSMGGMLRAMGEMFVARKATLVLLHHSTKPAGVDGQPIDLSDLSFAGFREFAAQWALLARRRPYEPGTGHHELWLSVGGRAGHSGLWGLNVDEGEYRPGGDRTWEISVLTADEAREAAKAAAGDIREQEREKRQAKQLEADTRRVVRAMARFPEGETAKTLRVAAGLAPDRFSAALGALVEDGAAVACDIAKPNRKKPYEGYKLVE